MKIPLTVDLNIEGFSGSGITDYESGITNGIFKRKGERYQVTQRPSIDITEDASGLGLNDRARGIYYWEANTKLYIVHDNDVYATTQDSTPLTSSLTAGTERVTILETLGDTPYLVFLDAENDEGWYMGTGETVTAIASNFPTTLVHGGAILDTYLFVMDENGIIYNSAVNDPTTFPATGFINSERENDKGVYLGKHHDHIVSLNTRTIEFFYNASNAAGSPLNRRQDISYNVGCASGLSVWEDGDIIYFLGTNTSGQIALYKLENFQLKQISGDALNSYLTQGLTEEGLNIVINGLSAMGHSTLLMTIYTLTGASPGQIVPKLTISHDAVTTQFGFWETNVNSHVYFPLMAWTKRTGGHNTTVSARTGEGILYNGDIININDRLVPTDTLLGTSVFESGVFEDDIFAANVGIGTNIPLTIRTGLFDGETRAYKFQSAETVEMENTSSSQTLTIKHSDEVSNSFDTGETVDTSDNEKTSYRSSRFMKRNYQLEYSGDEQIFLESLDVDLRAGVI